MKQKLLVILVFHTFPVTAISQQIEKEKIKVFYLGGQSNMDGYGKSAELPHS
jgi:hypothetical protein